MARVLGVLLVIQLLLPSVLSAQPAQALNRISAYEGAPLSLEEAAGIAAAQNLDLVALRRQLDALRLRPAQEGVLPAPMVGVQIWQWPINTLNPWKTNFFMPMMSQELPGRGKRQLRAAVAQKDVQLASTDVAMREREVARLLNQAYYELVVTRKATEIHQADIDLLHQIADLSQTKYASGSASQQDVLKNIIEMSQLHADLLQLDETARLAAARLNTLLNRPIDTPIGVLDGLEERDLTASLPQLQEMALATRPALIAARQQVERVEAELALAKADFKPDYSVQGGYMIMPNQSDSLMVQGSITWPRAPWSRKKIDLHIQELMEQVAAAKARVQAVESETRLMIETAFVRAKTAEQRASLLRTTILPQSRQTLDVSRVAYQSSQAGMPDVLDNQRMVLMAELEYDKALAAFQQALAELEGTIGEPLSQALIRPVINLEVRHD